MTYPQPSSPSAPLPLQDSVQEPDELTRFRDDWKHEVELHHHADTLRPADGLPDAQHYSAEELPQAQDSFVCLQHKPSPIVFHADDTLC